MNPMVKAHGLTKRFGATQAMARLDLVAEADRPTNPAEVALINAYPEPRGSDDGRSRPPER
jgi:hypothetical protein